MARPPSMKKVQEVYAAVRPNWLRRKGVLAVEIGAKTTRDAQGREWSGVEQMTKAQFAEWDVGHIVAAIIVYVEKKIDPGELRTNQLFPKEVDGVPVDVQTVPMVRLTQAPLGLANPLIGGVSVARQNQPGDFGTLTLCVVDQLAPAGGLKYLTCAHVAFDGPAGAPLIVQPPAGAGDPLALVGTSERNGLTNGALVDAATVRPTSTRGNTRSSLVDNGHQIAINGAGMPLFRDVVRFCGATTTAGLDGVVTNPDTTHLIAYPRFGNRILRGLFEVEGQNGRVAQGGDSGSLMYRRLANGRVEALGMVIGVATSQSGRQVTIAQKFLGFFGIFGKLGVNL